MTLQQHKHFNNPDRPTSVLQQYYCFCAENTEHPQLGCTDSTNKIRRSSTVTSLKHQAPRTYENVCAQQALIQTPLLLQLLLGPARIHAPFHALPINQPAPKQSLTPANNQAETSPSTLPATSPARARVRSSAAVHLSASVQTKTRPTRLPGRQDSWASPNLHGSVPAVQQRKEHWQGLKECCGAADLGLLSGRAHRQNISSTAEPCNAKNSACRAQVHGSSPTYHGVLPALLHAFVRLTACLPYSNCGTR